MTIFKGGHRSSAKQGIGWQQPDQYLNELSSGQWPHVWQKAERPSVLLLQVEARHQRREGVIDPASKKQQQRQQQVVIITRAGCAPDAVSSEVSRPPRTGGGAKKKGEAGGVSAAVLRPTASATLSILQVFSCLGSCCVLRIETGARPKQ